MNLLNDYIFSDTLRYKAHRLIYAAEEQPIELTGMLAAAILAALLVDTAEGDVRGIAVDGDAQREQFFMRYEREVRRENGGLFTTEVQALCQNHMELTGSDDLLYTICGNDRLYDLAFGLLMDYMHRLVREQVRAQIYELVPWKGPFAQWLFDAGYIETRRQHLLSIDWSSPAEVYAFAQQLENADEDEPIQPTFVFDGLSAEEVLDGYWTWLWNAAQQEAHLYPDDKVQLAVIKQIIRDNETDFEFLKPEMKDFTPAQINLFRKWMSLWTVFVEQKIGPTPAGLKKKDLRQEIFSDEIMPIPPERNYVKVREYILERCRYDAEFKKYFRAHKLTEMCRQLSFIFGWYVDDNALGKRMRSKAKK